MEENHKKKHHVKKEVLLKGAGMHLLAYTAIALLLSLLKVPSIIIFMLLMVFIWGLFVLGYAYYFQKK